MNNHRLLRRLPLLGALGVGLCALPAHAATFVVTNLNDSGAGSLRQAIADANAKSGRDAVQFEGDVKGTIVLTSGELSLTEEAAIVGPGADVLAVSGGNTNRIFNISAGGATTIFGLTLTAGRVVGASDGGEARGGAILNSVGTLYLKNSVLSQNSAKGGGGSNSVNPGESGGSGGDARGGAIYNAGTLSLSDSRLENNSALGGQGGSGFNSPRSIGQGGNAYGGAIYNANVLDVGNATFANNSVTGGTRGGVGQSPDVRDVTPTAQDINAYGIQNRPFSVQLQGTGDGTLTYSLVRGALPDGVTLNPTTGILSGMLTRNSQSTRVEYKVNDGIRDSNIATVYFIITPIEPQSLTVTTTADATDDMDNLTSLREAVEYANTLSTPSTIAFRLSGKGPYTLRLGDSALPISGNVTLEAAKRGEIALVAGRDGSFVVRSGGTLNLRNFIVEGSTNAALDGVVNAGTTNISNCSLIGFGGSISNRSGTVNLLDSFMNGAGAGVANGSLNEKDETIVFRVVRSELSGMSGLSSPILNGGTLNMSNSTYSGNSGSLYNTGTMNILGCTLSGNSTGDSGLLTNASGAVRLSNCTLYGNTANFQSNARKGLITNADRVNLDSCTITGNGVTPSGNGTLYNDGSGRITVRNSLVLTNSGSDLGPNATNFDVSSSRIGGTAREVGLQTDAAGNPLLKDNGGPTQTVALVDGSPVINAGQTSLKTDQRGLTRPAGLAPDIGAFESQNVLPAIFIDSPRKREGNSGATALTFTLRLSQPSTSAVSVVVNTSQGTATANSDYVPVPKATVTFAPGTTTQTFAVQVIGDTVLEPDETVRLALRSPVNAVLGATSGTGTLVNDDLPFISVDSPSVREGDDGTTALTFTLTLSQSRDEAVSVIVNTLQGTATAGTDYVSVGQATVRFIPGVTKQTFTVQVVGDKLVEGNESFRLALRSPVGATLATAVGTGTILDDDSAPKSPSLVGSANGS